jgi:hypothetical protein
MIVSTSHHTRDQPRARTQAHARHKPTPSCMDTRETIQEEQRTGDSKTLPLGIEIVGHHLGARQFVAL